MRRYVREIDDTSEAILEWHEMVGDGIDALCGLNLDPDFSMEFNFITPRYQHQRGTGFPNGDVCQRCADKRQWLDLDNKGPIYDDAVNHFEGA
jgi:hypothetical protein